MRISEYIDYALTLLRYVNRKIFSRVAFLQFNKDIITVYKPQADTTKINKFEFIDALRGVAALTIIVFHTVYIPIPNLQFPAIFGKFISVGGIGVTLFFAISAFTLYSSASSRKEESKKIIKFYLRRFFRIAPLFYCMIFFYVLTTGLLRVNLFNNHYLLKTLLLNVTFTYNFFPERIESIVWAGWTIGVEMIFYSLLPLLFLKVNNLAKSVLFAIYTIVISDLFNDYIKYYIKSKFNLSPEGWNHYVYMEFFNQLPVFAIGIICYFIYKKIIINVEKQYISSLLLALFFLFSIALVNDKFNFLIPNIYWWALNFCLLIFSLAIKSNKILVNKVTCFYGKISYSTYLIHPVIITHLLSTYQWIYSRFSFSTGFSLFVCVLLTLLILTPISLIAHYLIELPGIRFGKYLIAKI